MVLNRSSAARDVPADVLSIEADAVRKDLRRTRQSRCRQEECPNRWQGWEAGSISPASLIPSGRSMGPVTYRVLLVDGATGGVGRPTANRVS
jgi:hypothetical protein